MSKYRRFKTRSGQSYQQRMVQKYYNTIELSETKRYIYEDFIWRKRELAMEDEVVEKLHEEHLPAQHDEDYEEKNEKLMSIFFSDIYPRLTDRYKNIIDLILDDKSPVEIAHKLNIPPSSIYTIINGCRGTPGLVQRLQKDFDSYYLNKQIKELKNAGLKRKQIAEKLNISVNKLVANQRKY